MRIKNPQKVLEKRFELERELIEKYSVCVEDLAIYFETTPTVIRRDLRTLGIEAGSRNESVIEELIQTRNKEIEKNPVLENHGLWRNPRKLENIKIFKPLLNNLTSPTNKKEKILFLLELGWSLEDVMVYVNGLNNSDRKILLAYIHEYKLTPKYVKENDEEMNEIVRETLLYEYQKSVEREESYRTFRSGTFKIILNLTGASETKMYEFLGKESYADKRKEVLSNRKKETLQKKQMMEDICIKKEIYIAWKEGTATKNELAEAIGVSRQTIYNWISDEEIKEELKRKKNVDYLQGRILLENISYMNSNASERYEKIKNRIDVKLSLKENVKDNLEVYLEDDEEIETKKRMFG